MIHASSSAQKCLDNSEKNQYPVVYNKIAQILDAGLYRKKKSISTCKEFNLPNTEMKYEAIDRFGERLRCFYKIILSSFEELDAVQFISKKALKTYREWIEDSQGKTRWKIHVFRKKSWSNKMLRSR